MMLTSNRRYSYVQSTHKLRYREKRGGKREEEEEEKEEKEYMISSSVALFSNGKPVRYDGIVLACCVLFLSLSCSVSFSLTFSLLLLLSPSLRRITPLDTLSFLIGSCLPLVLTDGYSQLYKAKEYIPLD